MAGKIGKGFLWALGIALLALYSAFIYRNNDLGGGKSLSLSKAPVEKSAAPVNGNGSSTGTVIKTDNTSVESDTALDSVFNEVDAEDNFDDIVQ